MHNNTEFSQYKFKLYRYANTKCGTRNKEKKYCVIKYNFMYFTSILCKFLIVSNKASFVQINFPSDESYTQMMTDDNYDLFLLISSCLNIDTRFCKWHKLRCNNMHHVIAEYVNDCLLYLFWTNSEINFSSLKISLVSFLLFINKHVINVASSSNASSCTSAVKIPSDKIK